MRFVCLGYFDEAAFQAMPEAERNSVVRACLEYDNELKRTGHWAGGDALQSPASAATVRMQRGEVTVTDGPFAETKEQIGGILYLEANDLQQAIALMSRHPGVRFGPFEVRPLNEEFPKFAAAILAGN